MSVQRAEVGLLTPTYRDKKLIWEASSSATAGVDKYVPTRSVMYAHQADVRIKAVSGGWRAGKSLFSGMEGVCWLPFSDLIWLVAIDYDTSRMEFIYMAEAAVSCGLVTPDNVHIPENKYQPCVMTSITGCRVETRTLSDQRKLAARPPDVVIICEPGLVDDLNGVIELLMGRVAEKRGLIIMAGTSDESSEDWYQWWEAMDKPDNIEGGKAFSIPTWENLHSFPKGLHERDLLVYREKYGEEAFMAHYGGLPAQPRNLVLKGYWNRDVNIDATVEFDKALPIEIAIDPNYSLGNRYSVMAVQWDEGTGQEYIVDEVALEGHTHEEVIAECKTREWWRYVHSGTIDPYAGESHIFGSLAPVHYWKPYVDLRLDHRPEVATSVQALKSAYIGDEAPPIKVSPRCQRLIWEGNRWRQVKSNIPDKKSCDAQKALAYWLVDRRASMRMMNDNDDTNVVSQEWGFDKTDKDEMTAYA
jgi:hypothetical protein